MFNVFRSKSSKFLDPELERFRELTRNRKVLDALYRFNNGERRLSGDVALQVQECIQLSNSLTTRAQIISSQLFNAARSNRLDLVCERLSIFQERLDACQSQIDNHLDDVIDWANKYDLPPLSPNEKLFYKEDGIPRNKEQLMRLRYIHVPDAKIKEIPLGIAYLPLIQGICLSNNEIREIPSAICEMSNVIMLDIENNYIERIPENIGNMMSLSQADFDGNNIRNVPKSLLDLERLSVIRLKNQRHGYPLNHRDAPIDELSQDVLARLYLNGRIRLYV